MTMPFGASGVYPSPRGQPSIAFDLQPGLTRLIPSGTWQIDVGPYTCIQEYDPVQSLWQSAGGDSGGFSGGSQYISSDGVNYRVANLCGCIVGAVVNVAGSSYTSAPTVSFTNSASAAATAIIGGAVSTVVTVTNGGTNYTWNPLVFLDSPPIGAGYQATATCTISAAAVSTVTINNQGAGYTNVPNIYFINDPRDTTGAGATAVATLTGAQTVTQLLITNYGTPATTLQPTITFSSGSAAAFPIMVRSIGGISFTNVGSGYTGNVLIQAFGNGYTYSANVLTNPRWTTNMVRVRSAAIQVGVQTATTLTSAGASVFDGGIFAASGPTAFVMGQLAPTFSAVTVTFAAVAGFTWTNPTDTILLQPV
jgi:hypothetical protein